MTNKILLFLGSGVSFPSGLPDTKTITERILNEKWYEHTDMNFYKGEHPNEHYRKYDITPRIQKFLIILKEFSDPYFLSRRQSETNYEDLFYLCQQIEDNELFEIDNPLIDPFIKQLQFKLIGMDIFPSIPPTNKIIDLKYLSNRAMALIQCVVWNSLYFDGYPVGLDLILELKENIKFMDIATLNHDLLLEKVLHENKIDYVDGFGSPEGQIRYFDPTVYDNDSEVKLFKLHGSLNWYRFRITENNLTFDKYGLALANDIWHLKDDNGHFVTNLDGKPLFLTGSYNKMLDYNFGIYRIIHSKFDQALARNKIIIMSGYGWNDRGVNGRIFEWLGSSMDNRLILLHENPEDLKRYSRSALWHRYDELVKGGKLIPIEKWFSDVSFSEISKYL